MMEIDKNALFLFIKRLINAKIIVTKSKENANNMTLGEAIKITRQKAFFTQEAFAEELNVALSTVNRWELDKSCPNIYKMKLIKDFCLKNELSYQEIEKQWIKAIRGGKND